MNYAMGEGAADYGGYAPSFLPDGIASALGWVACGLVVFCFFYVLIPAARRTGKRR